MYVYSRKKYTAERYTQHENVRKAVKSVLALCNYCELTAHANLPSSDASERAFSRIVLSRQKGVESPGKQNLPYFFLFFSCPRSRPPTSRAGVKGR